MTKMYVSGEGVSFLMGGNRKLASWHGNCSIQLKSSLSVNIEIFILDLRECFRERTGKINEVKDVTDGYARNFLFAKNLAVPATKKVMTDLQGKKTKETIFTVFELIVVIIQDRSYTSFYYSIIVGQEKLNLRVIMKGMLTRR